MNNPEWTPPPPPQEESVFSNSTRQFYAEKIRKDAVKSLVLGILSLFCCGLIFGWFGYNAAQEAIMNIEVYEVEQNQRGLAMAGKILSIIGMIMWVIVVGLRIFAAVASS